MAVAISDFVDSSKRLPRVNVTGGSLYNTGADQAGQLGNAIRSTIARNKVTNPAFTKPSSLANKATGASGVGGVLGGVGAALAPAAAPQTAVQGIGSQINSAPTRFTTGTANNGTEPMKGWAAGMGYTPADVMGMNQMPARYLYDILDKRGMDPTGGLFYMMEPLADIMMPLFETIYGGGRDITKGFETNEIANFMGQMFGEYMTPGGRGADVSELFGHLLNPGGENTILNSYLNTGTPEEQVENFQRYAQMIGAISGSPMYQQALSNRLSERGYDYLNSFQGGQQPTNTFGQLVRNPGF